MQNVEKFAWNVKSCFFVFFFGGGGGGEEGGGGVWDGEGRRWGMGERNKKKLANLSSAETVKVQFLTLPRFTM